MVNFTEQHKNRGLRPPTLEGHKMDSKTIAILYTPKWIRDLQEKKKAQKAESKALEAKPEPKKHTKTVEKDK